MFELKTLHKEAIPRALERAEKYRVLNEPWEAESICLDILATEPQNQRALITLLLALTDQFGGQFGGPNGGVSVGRASEVLQRIEGEYERSYYEGVIDERWAKAALRDHLPGSLVYDWFTAALRCYERAEKLSSAGNEEAILRWNACVRQLQRHEHLLPHPDDMDAGFNDHVGPR